MDYEKNYREFHLNVPDDFNFAFDVIDRWAEDSDHRAMIWVDDDGSTRTLTHRDFSLRSHQVANGLTKLGLNAGDRVMVLMGRIPEWWESLLAMIRASIIALPATTQLTAKDIIYRAQTAQVRAILTDKENYTKFETVRNVCPDVQFFILADGEAPGWISYADLIADASQEFIPTRRNHKDDGMLIYFTSGTTGFAKMVLHTHCSYPLGHLVTGRDWLALTKEDIHWNLSDTGWAKAAWSSFFGPWNTPATNFVHNAKGKFSATQTLEVLRQYGITSFCAPPTAYRMLIREDLSNLPKLRSCVSAGEPLNPEVIAQWQAQTGLAIREGYGQTETALVIATFPGMEVKPGSMGRPAPGFVVDIIGDDGQPLPAGIEGDVGISVQPRPIGIFAEYWRDEAATKNSHRGDWYITGDRGTKDQDGYFWFVGRADDVIISAGYRIGPFEVESALIEHPAVLEAAVVGKADLARGQIVKAFIILRNHAQASDELMLEIQEFVKKTTAPYKYPREIEFVTELPKTVSGKIRRVALRQK